MADDGTKRLLLLHVKMLQVMCGFFPFCGVFLPCLQEGHRGKVILLLADGLKWLWGRWNTQAAAAAGDGKSNLASFRQPKPIDKEPAQFPLESNNSTAQTPTV